jgi:hypothetical protein
MAHVNLADPDLSMQDVPHEFLGGQRGEFGGEGGADGHVHSRLADQPDSFCYGQKEKRFLSRLQKLHGVGGKGIGYSFSIDLFSFSANLLENALVAKMDPIEISESEHRVFEGPPEIFRLPDDFHNLQKKCLKFEMPKMPKITEPTIGLFATMTR